MDYELWIVGSYGVMLMFGLDVYLVQLFKKGGFL